MKTDEERKAAFRKRQALKIRELRIARELLAAFEKTDEVYLVPRKKGK